MTDRELVCQRIVQLASGLGHCAVTFPLTHYTANVYCGQLKPYNVMLHKCGGFIYHFIYLFIPSADTVMHCLLYICMPGTINFCNNDNNNNFLLCADQMIRRESCAASREMSVNPTVMHDGLVKMLGVSWPNSSGTSTGQRDSCEVNVDTELMTSPLPPPNVRSCTLPLLGRVQVVGCDV